VNGNAGGAPHWLNITEAAAACGLSRDTVRRRIRSGALPGARRDPSGSSPWLIPIRDLLAAGLDPDRAAAGRAAPPDSGDINRRLALLAAERAYHRAVDEAAASLMRAVASAAGGA
jgi:hypothetical protein